MDGERVVPELYIAVRLVGAGKEAASFPPAPHPGGSQFPLDRRWI